MLWHAHLTALLCASINPQDALDEIARQKPKDLFKPLRVHFIGEDGIDAGGSKDTNKVGAGHSSPWTSDAVWAFSLLTHVEQDAEPPCKPPGPITLALPPFSLSPPNHFPSAGGVKKEFFQLLVTELLCPDYGMLIYQPESRTYWFNPTTLEADAEFLLLGLVRQGWGLVAVGHVLWSAQGKWLRVLPTRGGHKRACMASSVRHAVLRTVPLQVLGLAIYNGVLLDFPLPLALYRKILGQEVKLRDLEDMQPTLGRWVGGSSSHNSRVAARACLRCGAAGPVGDVNHLAMLCTHMLPPAHCCAARRSLRQLLQYEGPGSVEDVFCQTLTVEVPGFGDTRVVPLKEGGADVPVTGGQPGTGGSDLPGVSATQQPLAGRPLPTSPFLHPPSRAAAEENRREFVELYVDFWLNGSIHSQFEAFAKGFLMLCGGPALQVRCPAMGR